MSFDPRPFIKEIARGKHGARDLTREQARSLFGAILAGEIQGAALGAILVALRVKGESAEELFGMMEALGPHVRPMKLPPRQAIPVVIATYNGARKLPNLVPLLALLLAREGVPVLLHGKSQEAARVGSFEILERLGHAPAKSIEEAEERLDQRLVAPVPIELLAPDLARLLDVRLEIGVRNSGHTLAKLLLPQGVQPADACRLIAVTHPDFLARVRDYLAASPGNAFLMRGVEGEPVSRLNAPQQIEQIVADAKLVTHLPGEGEPGLDLPARDAGATSQWIRSVLEGAIPVPVALARQVALIADHCKACGAAARSPLHLVSSR